MAATIGWMVGTWVVHKTSFRDRVAKIERGEQYDALEQEATALRQQNAALSADVAQWQAAVGKWQLHAKGLQAKLAVASAVAWGRTTGKRIAAYAAPLILALVGWQAFVHFSPLPAEVEAGFGVTGRFVKNCTLSRGHAKERMPDSL